MTFMEPDRLNGNPAEELRVYNNILLPASRPRRADFSAAVTLVFIDMRTQHNLYPWLSQNPLAQAFQDVLESYVLLRQRAEADHVDLQYVRRIASAFGMLVPIDRIVEYV